MEVVQRVWFRQQRGAEYEPTKEEFADATQNMGDIRRQVTLQDMMAAYDRGEEVSVSDIRTVLSLLGADLTLDALVVGDWNIQDDMPRIRRGVRASSATKCAPICLSATNRQERKREKRWHAVQGSECVKKGSERMRDGQVKSRLET